MTIEICVDSFEQVKAAQKYGAKRVELCSSLKAGGLTPGLGLTAKCTGISGPQIHVMIRPRAGGFSYSSHEIEIMELDIHSFANAGVKGVVFGILNEKGNLDINKNQRLLSLAKSVGLDVTFHRAFDLVKDPLTALDQIIEMRFDRILTSGQKPKALDGISLIKELVNHANRRIQIMAGSGIDHTNVHEIVKTGVDAIHFTARKPNTKPLKLGLGHEFEVDTHKIRSILEALCNT